MNSATLSVNPLFAFWRKWHDVVLFKWILPRVQNAVLEGVQLDIRALSPLMKNNILTGRYEVQERLLAHRYLTREDVVLELGGAIGFIGLFCRKTIGVKYHFTVEANPNTIKMLRRNYALNAIEPNVIHAAAASEDGELTLNVGSEFWENSIVKSVPGGASIEVPALSLGSLVTRMALPPTTLICDIEGAEQFLDFSQLPATVNKIIIELHPDLIGKQRTEQILSQFSSLGFCIGAETAGTWFLDR